MGYETKLLIGRVCHHSDTEQAAYFMIYATVDLSKTGSDSHVSKLKSHQQDKPYVYWYFDGNTPEKQDLYGDYPIPLPIEVVADALKADAKTDDESDGYRRFKWASALLESMRDDPEQLSVLLYGH